MIRRQFIFTILALPVFANPATSDATPLPKGTWTDEKSGLYVSVVTSGKSDDASAGSVVGKQFVTIGAPPPRKGKADDIFLPKESKYEGGVLTVTGAFTWDQELRKVEITVTWKDGKVLLEIVKNEGYDRFPIGKHALLPEKR